ncbi:MAG: hypothetical protein JRM80_01540 [Nitrososphaerota archaeon]|nr:hypothetical protein [Nitrososphaerota archaeon]
MAGAGSGLHAVQVVIPAVNGEPGSDSTNQFNPQMITVVIGVNNTLTWTNLDQPGPSPP